MKKILLNLLFNIQIFNVFSTPLQVLILRHGEKLKNPKIEDQYLKLSKAGVNRALALSKYFTKKNTFLKKPIDAIFASTPRTLQTMAPTSTLLKKPIQTFFALNDNELKKSNNLTKQEIMSEKYNNKVIIICWSHGNIPILANLLGAKNAPSTWPNDVFNRFWILNYNPDGTVDFQNIKQNL